MIDARAIADDLIEAERSRTPIPPFTSTQPYLAVGTAYEAQSLFVAHHLDGGESLIGAKLGLTSRVKRQALGIHQPLYGWLTSGMLAQPGEALPLDRLIAPRAEPEIAFLIGDGLEAPATVARVLAATEAVVAAIEIVDSRYCQRFRLPDSVADNAGGARVVLGSQARRPSELEDLRLIGCVFRSRGEVIGTAAGGAVMGHPAAAVAWLVNTLAAQGRHLAPGSIVLSGGLTNAAPLSRRGVLSAEFDGLGSVGVWS
jgi:2-oxo-3-hexenedioate decarboxylase